jgi:hypothetical protein
MKSKIKFNAELAVDVAVYTVANVFILCTMFIVLKEFAELLMKDVIVRYYICGFLAIASLVVSVANIDNFHSKYLKNDSDSSKRQNDFFFESDLQKREGHNSDRRNMD